MFYYYAERTLEEYKLLPRDDEARIWIGKP
jgi:hypothetical protein